MNSSPPTPELFQANRWWTLVVLCLSTLLVTIDNTIVNVGLPTLSRELGASTSGLQWVVDAYVVIFAGLMLAAGGLGDRIGRKKLLQAGLFVFALASVFAALSDNISQLITGRALMGVGAAMIYPATLALLAAVFTDRGEKATAIGIWSAVSGLAIALGPVAGGLLLRHYHWSSLFLVNLPVIVIALFAAIWLVPESKSGSASHFDLAGALLSFFAVGVLVWTVIEAPQYGWGSAQTVGGFAISGLLLLLFAGREYQAKNPLVDIELLRNARFSAASACIAIAFFGLFGFIFLITQFFQAIRGYDTLKAGLATLPFAIVIGTLSPVAIAVMKLIGTKFVVFLGLLLMSSGFGIVAVSPAHVAYWGPIVISMVLMAAGLAFVTGPATDAIMSSLELNQAGAGAAVNDTTREFGGALGVAVLGTLMNLSFKPELQEKWGELGLPADIVAQGQQSIMASLTIAGRFPSEIAGAAGQAANAAFMSGLHAGSFTAAIVALVAAMNALLFLPGRDANTPHPGNQKVGN